MRHALIHRARETGSRSSAVRSDQGQYDPVPYEGPEVRVRFMERGVAARQRRDDTSGRQARTYELLADFVDVDGADFELKSGMRLLVVAEPVTPPEGWEVEVDGDPERLNDGRRRIGWMSNVTQVGDAP